MRLKGACRSLLRVSQAGNELVQIAGLGTRSLLKRVDAGQEIRELPIEIVFVA
jgi:hypothetical protein